MLTLGEEVAEGGAGTEKGVVVLVHRSLVGADEREPQPAVPGIIQPEFSGQAELPDSVPFATLTVSGTAVDGDAKVVRHPEVQGKLEDPGTDPRITEISRTHGQRSHIELEEVTQFLLPIEQLLIRLATNECLRFVNPRQLRVALDFGFRTTLAVVAIFQFGDAGVQRRVARVLRVLATLAVVAIPESVLGRSFSSFKLALNASWFSVRVEIVIFSFFHASPFFLLFGAAVCFCASGMQSF